MTSPNYTKLQAWIRRINEREMPILARTAQEISRIAGDENAPMSNLINVILQDANMTARVLRLANSAYYSGTIKVPLSTISRAVIVLGFDEIRTICILGATISELLKGAPHERLFTELATALQTAVQAKHLAKAAGESDLEEVFVAALLFNLGEMAFLSLGGEEADKFELELERNPQLKPAQLERRMLGFLLSDLSLGLSRLWNLGALLEGALTGTLTGGRAKCVVLSHRFARAAREGWDSPQAQQVRREIGNEFDMEPDEIEEMLASTAAEAVEVAKLYGAPQAAMRIALPPKLLEVLSAQEGASIEEVKEVEKYPEPAPVLQLKILREISGLMSTGANVSQVVGMVLEGLYRGVGLDRVFFAILTPDRSTLVGKTSVGINANTLGVSFSTSINGTLNAVFRDTIRQKDFTWVKDKDRLNKPTALTKALDDLLEMGEFFIGPALVEDQPIGLYYADRRPSRRPLDDESFESFQHFVMQGNMSLSLLGGRKR